MNTQAREKILEYIKKNASLQTFHVLEKFFKIIGSNQAPLEMSSESFQDEKGGYIRLALSCLRKDQALELLSQTKYKKQQVKAFMIPNREDACFGLGIADYGLNPDEQRIKLYNYYHLENKITPYRDHLRDICKKAKISWSQVEGDINYFKKVRMSAVDFYDKGNVELKVYYGPFWSEEVLTKFQTLFNATAIKKYKKLLVGGDLSRLVLFCVRYNPHGRSIRTDFWCQTRDILPHIKKFDLQGDAKRLYKDLCAISLNQVLTYICIDLDKRPRTQFYFLMYDL